MPTFTVIVKDDDTKTERIVTVNTATMEATIIDAPVAEQTVASVASVAMPVTEPVAQPAVEIPVTPENNALSGLTGLFNEKKPSGGKRSTPSFRLKKRRITRKHKKTR